MAFEYLIENINNMNLAEGMDAEKLAHITSKVITGFQIDDASRTEWKEQTEEGIKVAEQIVEMKTYPWPGASNVKFPLIAISAIQFAARAYPSIVQGDKVVKAQVIGEDRDGKKADRAKRVSTHMSWQLTEKMAGWDEETDKLLHILPVVGTVFRKTFYNYLEQETTSDLCLPLDVVVHMKTKNLDRCRRVTHIIHLYKNEVLEREIDGLFIDKEASYMNQSEEDQTEIFLEQHRWLDLDDDGYEEPYIVTVHQDTGTLVRIIARYDVKGITLTDDEKKIKRITPVQYFTAYFFIPSASGKFYAMGFAHLLGPINESINTSINMLLDAGHLANTGGGFLGRGIRFKGGVMRFTPGEWKQVDITGGALKDNLVPNPSKEPSSTLFQLLGLLNDTGMKLASVSETMAGESPSQNTPATTTLAVIEQGLKVFTAIYKRIFRSLKSEFKKIHRLNGFYTDEQEYYRVLDEQNVVFKMDYNANDLDIVPVADPTLASDAQRLARVQALLGTIEMVPTPGGKMEILGQFYEGLQAQNIDKILPKDQQGQYVLPQPPPDPAALELELDTQKAVHEEERLRHLLPYDAQLIIAKIATEKAKAAKLLADAAAVPIMNEFAVLKQQVADMHRTTELEISRESTQITRESAEGVGNTPSRNPNENVPGGAAGMAPTPDNLQGAPIPEGMPAGAGAGVDGGGDLGLEFGGEGGSPDDLPIGGDQGQQPYPEGTTR